MDTTTLQGDLPATRIGDAERERVRAVLERHTTDGRITLDEYAERLGAVFAARTAAELSATLRGLPELPPASWPPPPAGPGAAATARAAVIRWAALAALLVAIWVLAGGGYFWPVWPILGVGLGALAKVRVVDEGRPGTGSGRPARGPVAGRGACGWRAARR